MHRSTGALSSSSSAGTGTIPHKGNSVYTLAATAETDSPLGSLVSAFLLEYRPGTAEAYARDLGCFIRWFQTTTIQPLACRRAEVASYLQWLRDQGYAEATIGRRLACLRSFYRYTVDEEILTRSPAASVRWRNTRAATRGSLTIVELRRLLEAADLHSPRVAAAVWVLATTGTRVSEVCTADASPDGLRRTDPSWLLRIVRKGGTGAWVPLHPAAVDRLTDYLRDRMAGPLLQTASGRPWDRRTAHRTLAQLGRDLGLQMPVGPHLLRHTLVTLARSHGCPLETIQDTVGHANPRTTRGYDHTDPASLTQPSQYLLAALGERTRQ